MKKIILTMFLIAGIFGKIQAQEFGYQLLGPFQVYGEGKFSEYFFKGDMDGFKQHCLNEVQNSLKAIYGSRVKEMLLVSAGIKDDEVLKNTIYIRANISRMQLSYELLGKENFQYALRTTGGIEFFNVRTGEVYFSKIYTIIQPKQIIKSVKDNLTESHKTEFFKLFKNNITELFKYLIQKSKDEYKPGIINANIIKTVSDFSKNKTGILESKVIINKGRLQGIAERQQFKFNDSKSFPEGVKLKISEIQDNYSFATIVSPKSFSMKNGEGIYRSGGVEISSKFPLRMMVEGTQILDNTQIDSRFGVDQGFITQIIHDNLSDNSSFLMLPYGSIAEQQLESTKGGEKEEEVIGNRQRPDIYVKCIISKAYVYSTEYEGGEYLKLVVSPILVFYDANLGNILYSASFDEENLQVIKENERLANINEQFEILTKNAIYEVTKKAKTEFSLLFTKGNITAVSGLECQFKIEKGLNSPGAIYRIYKAGSDVIDPVSNKNLGKMMTYAGNFKTKTINKESGSGLVLFTNETLSSGDILLSNSDKNLSKGMAIIQPRISKIAKSTGESYSAISFEAAEITVMHSLVESKNFNVILPQKYIEKIQIDRKTLEPAGHFKINNENEDKTILKPEIYLNSEILIFPPEIQSETEKKLTLGEYFILNSADGKQLVRKGKKLELPLEAEKNKEQVQVGLAEKDFPKHYLNILKSISVSLSNVVLEELQKISK